MKNEAARVPRAMKRLRAGGAFSTGRTSQSLPCVRGGGAAKPRRRGCQACRISPHLLQYATANRQPLSQPNG